MDFLQLKKVYVAVAVVCVIASGVYLVNRHTALFLGDTATKVLDEAWIKNARYEIDNEMVQLTDGMSQTEYSETRVATYALGRLSNSNKTEAIVVLETKSQETMFQYHESVHLVLWNGSGYEIVPSPNPILVPGENILHMTLYEDQTVMFTIERYRWMDRTGSPTVQVEERYQYRDHMLHRVENEFVESMDISALDKVTIADPNIGQALISPDGEWLFEGQIVIGRQPFVRQLDRYLKFVSLTGKGDRYVYQSYFPRPEDGNYSSGPPSVSRPIGWSADGTAVYTASVDPLLVSEPELPVALEGYWANPRSVYKKDLGSPLWTISKNRNSHIVKPESITDPTGGVVLDILPEMDRALWFQPGDESSSSSIIYFNPFTNTEEQLVAKLASNDGGTVVSASLDRNTDIEHVAYAVHYPDKNDTLHVYEKDVATQEIIRTTLDIESRKDTFEYYNVEPPYRLFVQKTSLQFSSGLFVVVVGSNNEVLYVRYRKNTLPQKDSIEGKWEIILIRKGRYI